MSSLQLHSLDALILTVRDPESRRLAQDAVAAYQGGALRAAVLSIWVAVCADIISKLRELANAGEAAAVAKVAELDGWITNNEKQKFQGFENSVVELAKAQFEILLPHEATDLERLKADRNFCAHPAFVGNDALFSPTPELVRAHIVHAIIHLLSRAPIQGKQLVVRFDRDLTGGSFPRFSAEIELVLRKNYLARAKPTAILTLIKALSKALVGSEAVKYKGRESQIAESLAAIGRILPAVVEQQLPPVIEKLGIEVSDDRLLNLCYYIQSEPRIWDWLGDAGQTRVLARIDNTAFVELDPSFASRNIPEVGKRLLARLKVEPIKTRDETLTKFPCRAFVSEALERYQASGSFASAEKRGADIILPHAKYFLPEDIARLNTAIRENAWDQILKASGSATILKQVFAETTQLLPQAAPYWAEIAAYIIERQTDSDYEYPALLAALATAGVAVPTPPTTPAVD